MGYVLAVLLGVAFVGFFIYGVLFGVPWWSWPALIVGVVAATFIGYRYFVDEP